MGIGKSGQIWVMLRFGLAAGGGERCKDDGRFLMGPLNAMGKPEEGAGRKCQDLILGVLNWQPLFGIQMGMSSG